jgi:hypothetical protein
VRDVLSCHEFIGRDILGTNTNILRLTRSCISDIDTVQPRRQSYLITNMETETLVSLYVLPAAYRNLFGVIGLMAMQIFECGCEC